MNKNISTINNHEDSKCNQLDDYGRYTNSISNQILIIYPWIMIIFGTVSNTLSIVVLTRRKLRKSSTFFYLACLSAIDLVNLYTFCINFITYYHLKIDLQSKSIVLCKLFAFCIYFLPQYSAWTCAAVSIDRVIGVIFTINGRYAAAAKRWNTPIRARNIVFIIGVCLFLINVQFLFYPNEYTATLESNRSTVEDVNVIYCSPENIPRYQKYYNNVWVYIDLSINVLIPFAIMIISSVIIIIRVQKTAQNLVNTRKKSSASYNSVSIHGTTAATTTPTTPTAPTALPNSFSNGALVNAARKKSNQVVASNSKARNISTMLATNNFVFISLTLPIVVFLSIAPAVNDSNVCANIRAKMRLIKIICIILMNTNCTVNIFVYSAMASQFRRELIGLFSKTICKRLFFGRSGKESGGNFYTNNNKSRGATLNHRSNSLINQNLNDNTMTITYT